MKPLTVTIIVGIILAIFFSGLMEARVVKVKAEVEPREYSGQCPKRFLFKAVIASDSPGEVVYKWIRSDGAIAPEQKILFRKRGAQTVETYWELGAAGKHWEAVEIIAPNRMVSNKAIFVLKCGPQTGGLVTQIKPVNQTVIGTRVVPVDCPNPAVISLDFSIVQRHSQFRGRIRVTAVVKNVGKKAFVSGPNQAKAYLYELPSGLPPDTPQQGKVVAEQAIVNLAPDGEIRLTYERDWNSSSPNEGEFPNSYRCMILYDPDITMDSNKENDDCNNHNNRKERSGTEINDMLR